MTIRDNGGPAFPGGSNFNQDYSLVSDGMTLRDWFAGQALTGMSIPGTEHDEDAAICAFRAAAAYQMADAMLAERAK